MQFLKRFPWYVLLYVSIGALTMMEARAQITFTENALSIGLGADDYDSSSRHGLGIIWIDYDNDGFPDLFASNGSGNPAHLYHNNGDGTFSDADALLPSLPLDDQTSAMFADYDNDGDQDIYLMTATGDLFTADGPVNILLQNQFVENGNTVSTPLFVNVAAAAGLENKPAVPFGTRPGYKSYTGAWLDYDRDSCIDLFVGNMVWDQGGVNTNANQLYKNNCDGTFTDVTLASGVDTGDANDYRPTLAFFGGLLTPGDLDPDLYVVNVHDASPYHHDLIYANNGDGTFTEFSGTMPTFGDDSGAGMGTAVGDIDRDGDWDIYITDLPDPPVEPVREGNTLYLGNPDGTWSENAGPAAGVASGPSWGANFTDFDLDGFEDLWVGTIAPDNEIQTVYRNDGDGTFTDVTAGSGFVTGHEARGTAAADYDHDGDIDIVQVNLNGRITLFQNTTVTSNNWLKVDLTATVSNRSAIGTLVEATVGGATMRRQVNGGASAHSQDDLVVHFGVGTATSVDELRISWPSGIVQTLTNVGVNQTIGVTEQTVAPGDLFTDVSGAAGVSVLHDGGNLEDMGMGTGAAWFDYDNDGDQDLYMTMRTGANKLFQNNGGTFVDVAAAAGAADASHDGSGVAIADYDNDGDKDIYLANSDEDVFLENNGDGTFTDITTGSGLEASGARRGTSASWGDFDNDGLLDLYVAHHEPMQGSGIPDDATQAQDYLYRNNGDGTFTDVSDSHLGTDRQGHSFIGAWTDYDNDGDLDIYKIRDCPFEGTETMRLWRNDGGTNGVSDWTFTQVAESVEADWCQNGMGIAVGDYDRDGDMDFFYSDNGADGSVPPGDKGRAGTVLLRNDGTTFSEVTTSAGVHSAAWSWGANFFDYDLDGFQDLYLAAGEMNNFVDVESVLWRNDGDGTFTNTSAESGGLNDPARTRTSVYADYDEDGDPDMFLVNYAGLSKLFRNDNNNFNNWVIIDLQGTTSNRDGIGARLELSMSDGGTQYFETRSGSSLGGGDDLAAYFGLGSGVSVSNLTITWPSGTVQNVGTIGHNQRHLIVEDGGTGGSTLAVSPTSVDFGTVEQGSASNPVALTLTNQGLDPIDVTDVTLSGVNPNQFTHDFFGTATIPGGGTGTINVTFSPSESPAQPFDPAVLYRVNAGGAAVADWLEDSGSNPSAYVNDTATSIESTTDPITLDATVPAGTPMELFQSNRTDASKQAPIMEWDFPVVAGDELTVRIFFAEFTRCQSGGHVFDVVIEGTTVLDEYEVFADVGCETGTMKAFSVTPTDDNLDIDFPLGGANRPSIVAGIEVESVNGGGGSDLKTAQLNIDHTGINGSLSVSLSGTTLLPGGNTPPQAAFTFDIVGLNVDFNDASTDSDGSVVSWSWDFGDGNTSTEQNPTNVYAANGTYSVSLTVTDDEGATDTETQDVTVTDGNESPIASFTSSVADLTVDFTDTSTDDGSIASWAWDFGDGNTSTDQNPSHTYGAYGVYSVSLTVTDDQGATGSVSEDVNVADPNGSGAFTESGGMAVMEAENFHDTIARSGDSWVLDTGNAGFSGAGAMVSTPDDGTFINSDVTTTSPELSFDVDISTTGDYHLWVRMWSVNSAGNSVHLGMDGTIDALSKGVQSQTIGAWTWNKLSRGSNPLVYNVASAGLHTVNVWMREDGTLVDKVVITTDGNFTPTGEGPAESPRASASVAKNGARGLDALSIQGEDDVIDLPTEFALKGNYPNPFNPTTTISFDIPEAVDVRLEVYDIMGRRIATLANGPMNAGRFEATWNARSDAGTSVSSGVYIYRLQAGSFQAVRQMVLMK